MKITLEEHDGCFAFDMQAETTAEAALLVRFGMNRTNEIRTAGVQANRDGTFTGNLIFGKHKHANNDIPKRR
jgi:hypothetical protein